MVNKVLKINKDEVSDDGISIDDHGDGTTRDVNLDGLNKFNITVVEKQKIINDFIRKFLPDSEDSRRFNKFRTTNKVRTIKATSDIDKDILILPETGEKVCKTDIKLSYNSAKDSIKTNFVECKILDTKINQYKNGDSKFKKEEAQHLKVKLNNIKNESVIDDVKNNTKDIIENKIQRKYEPVNPKFINKILNDAGVTSDFKGKNECLHKLNYKTKLKSNNETTNNDMKEPNIPLQYTKLDRSITGNSKRLHKELHLNKDINRRIENERAIESVNLENRKKMTKEINSYHSNTSRMRQDYHVTSNSSDLEEVNHTHSEIRKEKNKPEKRRPLIKTMTLKTDPTKIYKAVTFVDTKDVTPLKINMPSIKRKKSKISVAKANNNTQSVKEKIRRKKRNESPESLVASEIFLTEVAKWNPTCINELTKPYYEAWVNTTLAAITRNDNDKEKQKVLESFRKLQRPKSPELIYENFYDEKYAGRIIVRRNDRKHRSIVS